MTDCLFSGIMSNCKNTNYILYHKKADLSRKKLKKLKNFQKTLDKTAKMWYNIYIIGDDLDE